LAKNDISSYKLKRLIQLDNVKLKLLTLIINSIKK